MGWDEREAEWGNPYAHKTISCKIIIVKKNMVRFKNKKE